MNAPAPRLLTLFVQRRPELGRRLQTTSSAEERRQLVSATLRDLREQDGDARSARENRVILRQFELLERAARSVMCDPDPPTGAASGEVSIPRRVHRGLIVVALAAATLSLFGLAPDRTLQAVLILCALGLMLAGDPQSRSVLRWLRLAPAAALAAGSAVASRDATAVLDLLAAGIDAADQLLDEMRQPVVPPSAAADLRRLPAVLDFLHQCLGPLARRDAARLLEVAEPLPQLLQASGLRVVSFDPKAAPDAARWLLQPSRDASRECVTLTPALLDEEGGVVRPGRARVPAEAPA